MLETSRLLLRNYTLNDYKDVYDILSDDETMQYYPAPFDENRTRHWIEWNLENYKRDGFGLWAVVLKETGALIGDCGVTMQTIEGEVVPELGYHINKNYWQQGYAKEASLAVCGWFFNHTQYEILYSYMKYTNKPSYQTAVSIGMTKVKEYLDPINTVSYVYAMTRTQWQSLPQKKS